MGVTYELKQNGTQIFVDEEKFDQVLIKLYMIKIHYVTGEWMDHNLNFNKTLV